MAMKARLTVEYLKRKMEEYEKLQRELDELKEELRKPGESS